MNNYFNENVLYTSPSDIIEFNYCKRFIYYMKNLNIPQNEHNRYKVQKGRDTHYQKSVWNINYLRKKINVIDKKINVSLYSNKYGIKGVVDEILYFNDGSIAPLDYKFARFNNVVYDTYKMQMVMYSIMIREVFDIEVNCAYLVYCLSNNLIYKLNITDYLINKFEKDLNEYKKIINGYYPSKTKYKKRCFDCCYRNICIQ